MLKVVFEGDANLKASSVTLIETSKHRILVDTSSKVVRDVIVERLAELGFSTDDIDVVINTHLHSGHTGNNEIFKNAKVFASPHECVEKCKGCLLYFDRYTKFLFTPISELEDEEVMILNTPGHTWGSLSVVYEDYIIAGDAIPLKANAIEGIVPKCVDERYAKSSIRRIKMLGKNIITGHEGVLYVDEFSW